MNIETLLDVEQLIDTRIEEGLVLEYKSKVNDSNRETAKDISAFANTEGGTIIYGVDAKDRIPTGMKWIRDTGVEEKIQNLARMSIQPELVGVHVTRLANPKDSGEAIVVVHIPKSLEAPHMADNRYYRRQGSTSVPMNHTEVKAAIFSLGRRGALKFEISQNLELANRTYEVINRVYVGLPPDKRMPIVLVPLHTDAWNSIIASGLLYSLDESAVQNLVEVYRLIHEVNSLIEWLKIPGSSIVHTPADLSSVTHGTYLPALIRDKLAPLANRLQEARGLLQAI